MRLAGLASRSGVSPSAGYAPDSRSWVAESRDWYHLPASFQHRIVDSGPPRSTHERNHYPQPKENIVQYLLMIYANEAEENKLGEAVLGRMLQDYGEYTKSIVQGGQFKGGARLRPVADASTVRVRDGKTLVTDGPFAETREQLGGFYLVEAKNLDEAIALAARIPSARHGSIEVRPIWPTGN
jgi:hypothetical protein